MVLNLRFYGNLKLQYTFNKQLKRNYFICIGLA